MLAALLLVFICGTVRANQPFNVTHLILPELVPPGQNEVEIECRYEGDFTTLSLFKSSTEFFRYTPYKTPVLNIFSTPGVGQIDIIMCGPSICKLQLSALTEEATGFYKCYIDFDRPPYQIAYKKAYMRVHEMEHRKPFVQGVAEEYAEGDEIEAYCRGVEGVDIRWYVNGKEVCEMRGFPFFKKTISRLMFMGVPLTMCLQCGELRNKYVVGSKEVKARWGKIHKVINRNSGVKTIKFSNYVIIIPWTFINVIGVNEM